tara:strand:- start:550 stop:888 length:339 start_codon:yes stop_codon:yes gene_type:complete
MARRKNTKFIDPRYFMDEKMERLDESSWDRAVHPDYPSGYGSDFAAGGADYAGPGTQEEQEMPEAFIDQPGDAPGKKLWKDAMRKRWEQYLAGDKGAFDQLSPELRKELGLP